MEILQSSAVGMPSCVQWGRYSSGGYFCFYQRGTERVRPKEAYPDLLEAAKAYERPYEHGGNTFTGCRQESLTELERPERMEAIKKEHAIRKAAKTLAADELTLTEIYKHREAQDENPEGSCLFCHL